MLTELAGELTAKALGDETGGAAGDIDVLADQIGVDARDEVLKVQVDVLDLAVQLGGVVVAQPLGVQTLVEIALRRDEGAAALAHLLSADSQIAVGEDAGRRAQASIFQRGWPEQRVKIQDVLADEMINLGVGIGLPVFIEVEAVLRAVILERGEVADRRVEPDIEELARRVGDLEAEVGRIARNVPVAQIAFEPFLHLVSGFRL